MDAKNIQEITNIVMSELSKLDSNNIDERQKGIMIGVSARHIHLSQDDVNILFGNSYELTKKKDLMGGQYACNETVSVISEKMKVIENIRVLGPVRKQSQLEISSTDSLKLGIRVPIRQSGDVVNSASITILGPKGTVYLNEGLIVAARHIHMSPDDAKYFSCKDNDIIKVRLGTVRSCIFENVKVRVDESFTLEMHIDTDEANTAGVRTGDFALIVK